ncbi:MAG: ribose-phosphate pyrophosphokinase [Patiriisocius sp.]|jgi:ribose-phosphate pyrophosphokinase
MAIPQLLSWGKDGIVIMTSKKMDPVAKNVARNLQHRGVPIEYTHDCVIDIDVFSDGELCTTIKPNVRDKTVFLFWDFTPKNFTGDINIRVQALETALGALKASGVGRVILVAPYLPYSRQERPMYREPLSAKDLARKLEGFGIIKYLVTFDLHAPQIAGFYNNIEVLNIPAHVIFAPFFKKYFAEAIREGTLKILATDVGGSKRGRDCAEKTDPGLDIAIIDKRRDKEKNSKAMKIVGDTSPIMIGYDDIGGTMTTLFDALNLAIEKGAKMGYGAVAHNVLGPKKVPGDKGGKLTSAEAKIKASKFTVFTLDTLPRGEGYYQRNPLIVPVPYVDFMAELALEIISVDGSIGKMKEGWTT